jgi:hypothetical protein
MYLEGRSRSSFPCFPSGRVRKCPHLFNKITEKLPSLINRLDPCSFAQPGSPWAFFPSPFLFPGHWIEIGLWFPAAASAPGCCRRRLRPRPPSSPVGRGLRPRPPPLPSSSRSRRRPRRPQRPLPATAGRGAVVPVVLKLAPASSSTRSRRPRPPRSQPTTTPSVADSTG